MLYRSQEEINSFYSFVIEDVAKKLGIERELFQSVFELQTLIELQNKNVYAKLNDFLDAYQDWYDVHVKINDSGNSGNLNTGQNQQLVSAVLRRDTTRQDLKVSLL